MYYYRKRRQGERVVSEYIGKGLAGELADLCDKEDKLKADVGRAELQEQKATAAKLGKEIRKTQDYTRTITRAVLLLSGYHAPRRQWRKLRT
jgi:hypothetical protein